MTISEIINALLTLISFFSNNNLYNHGEWAMIYVNNYFEKIEELRSLKDQFLDLKSYLEEINNKINNFTAANELIAAEEAAYDRYLNGKITRYEYIENYQNPVGFELNKIGYYDLLEERTEIEEELKNVQSKLEDPRTKNSIWYWAKKFWFCAKWNAHHSAMAEEWAAINDQYKLKAEEALKRAEAAKDLEIAAETDQEALDQYCIIVDDLEKIVQDLQEIKSVNGQNKIHKDLRSKYGLDPMGFIE